MFSIPKAVAQEVPKPEKTSIRQYTPIKYGVVAGEVISGDLPKDHFIHAIKLRVNLGTLSGGASGSWNSDAAEKIIKSLVVKAEGTTYFKQGKWLEFKQICIANLEPQADGSVKLYFVDPKIEETKPLPSWKFTSLVIELDFEALTTLQDGDRDAQSGTDVKITVIESHFDNHDMSYWPTLIEAVRTKKTYGDNEEWQVFEHERANVVTSLLYHADDDGTDSDVIFDKLKLIGRVKNAQYPIYDEVEITDIQAENKTAFNNQALGTGFWMIEWAKGLDTSQFTSLKSELFIGTAGTKAGMRVMERYLL